MLALADTIRVAIDLDGVLTEHPRPLAHAASAHFGQEMPESAFVDSAGLNVPVEVRDWVYGEDGPAAALRPAPDGAAFLRDLIALLGADNVKIVTARPERAAAMTLGWLRRHRFAECEILYADLKAAMALRYRLAYAIEDSLRHARNYASAGVTCFLVNASETPAPHERGIIPTDDLTSLGRHLASMQRHIADDPGATNRSGADADQPMIVISDAIHAVARSRFSREARIVDIDGTDRTALLAAVRDADALVVRSETEVDVDVLTAAARLRVVARAGVGVDNIDLNAATQAGVLVLNAPGANAVSAGEHTISLLLAVARQLAIANDGTHAGRWERKLIRPVDLRGRTLGIVGLGRVGSVVARRLQAFEMKMIAYDPYIPTQRFTELAAAPVDYQTLLASADVVTFHVPATAETTGMLDAAAIELLKPGAIVLNVARGEVVDQDALAAALREGRIAGAGVDVYPREPAAESPLFGLPNVILTPHTGGSSAEALAAVGEVISTTTLAALRGEAVPNAVNMPAASLHAPDLQRLTTIAGAAGHLLAVLAADRATRFNVVIRGLVPVDVTAHVVSAALAATLQQWTDQRITPVNARLVADEIGLPVRTVVEDPNPDLLPEFSLQVDGEVCHHVTVRWDRTDAAIMEVDGFSLNSPLAGDVLITHHHDQPGVIGQIGTILGRHDVNIAGMQVGRHQPGRGGEAIMVLNVDDEIPEAALGEIKAIPGIATAYVVSLPAASTRPVQTSMLAGLA